MTSTTKHGSTSKSEKPAGNVATRIAVAWAIVGIPLAYGVYETVKKASALFT